TVIMVHQLVYNNTAATVVPASQSPPQEEYLSAYALARSRSSHIRSRSVSSVASDCIRSVSSRSSSASRTPSAASVTTDASGTLHPRDYHRIRAQQKLALSSTSSNGGDSTDKLQQRSNSVTRRNTITTTVETSATVAVSAHAYASEECS